jgi:hypothetical protein
VPFRLSNYPPAGQDIDDVSDCHVPRLAAFLKVLRRDQLDVEPTEPLNDRHNFIAGKGPGTIRRLAVF